MRISKMSIHNFKSIRELSMEQVESAMILVGRNNTGKTVVIDAILTVAGLRPVQPHMFQDIRQPITMDVTLHITKEDLELLYRNGIVSKEKDYTRWLESFQKRLPGYEPKEVLEAQEADGFDGEFDSERETKEEEEECFDQLSFQFVATSDGKVQYVDGTGRHNPYIPAVFPEIHYIDNNRSVTELQEEIFALQGSDVFERVKSGECMYDETKLCDHCFACIKDIQNKRPLELSVVESARLMEYQIHNLNIRDFSERVNQCFQKNNGPSQEVQFTMQLNRENMFNLDTLIVNKDRKLKGSLQLMSAGTKSIYLLSLLEAYIAGENSLPCMIMMEDPESYLHPQLQKVAGEILYRLSKKNQVVFSTHSPNMIFNFTQKQIKQVVLDDTYSTTVRENVDIDEILDDLGYTANDLMNVSFVFIVEGKQDSNRLPLLLEKYYSEIYDEDGMLQRISIIITNSCTNIKTYANLKYINKLYLKDQFLMIRDSDGKNPRQLTRQLCSYYDRCARQEGQDAVPRIQQKNVLILKYYSFENYFLDPKVMTEIGVLKREEDFYSILYEKYKAYLYRIGSFRRLEKRLGLRFRSKDDIKKNIEAIKIYVRGHNLYDIFYGRYRGEKEQEILKKYIDAAPRECFADILDSIDRFVYFESRKKTEE